MKGDERIRTAVPAPGADPVYDHRITKFGFDWGPMVVERAVADNRAGWVLIVRTRDRSKWVEVRMSPRGHRLSVREQEAVS